MADPRYVYTVVAYDVNRGDFFRDPVVADDKFGGKTVWNPLTGQWYEATDSDLAALHNALDALEVDDG